MSIVRWKCYCNPTWTVTYRRVTRLYPCSICILRGLDTHRGELPSPLIHSSLKTSRESRPHLKQALDTQVQYGIHQSAPQPPILQPTDTDKEGFSFSPSTTPGPCFSHFLLCLATMYTGPYERSSNFINLKNILRICPSTLCTYCI